MNRYLTWLSIPGAVVTVAVLTGIWALAQPTGANAATIGAQMGQTKSGGYCTVEISTVALTPLVAYDGSGGNVLFAGTLANEAACDRQALSQWRTALQTGWSAANRCAIIAQTGPSDEILTEITYIWNSNPSVREDGYAVMCHPTVDVQAPAY